MIKFILFVFVLALSAPFVFSHLEGGQDKVVDGVIIDFGYSPEVISSDEPATLAFNLAEKASLEILEPSSVRIRVFKNEELFFAGTILPKSGSTLITYTFPEEGAYEVDATFNINNSEIAAVFTVNVGSSDSSAFILSLVAAFLLLLIFFIAKSRKP